MNRLKSLQPNYNKIHIKDEFENELQQAAQYSLLEIYF